MAIVAILFYIHVGHYNGLILYQIQQRLELRQASEGKSLKWLL